MIADTEPKKKKKRSRKEKAPPEDCVDGDCSVEVNEISEDSTDAHSKQSQKGSTEYQQTSDNDSKRKNINKSSM